MNAEPLHILLIEDDASTQRAWKVFLEDSRRHEIVVVTTGDEAASAFSANPRPFDIIICDGQLGPSAENGWDIINRLRTWAEANGRPMPPVIAAPGVLTPATERKWRTAGVSHIHPKPFDVFDVLTTIAELTKRPPPT